MLKSHHHQSLLALACITLLFGIVSCDTVYCYSSSCTQTVYFYATGVDYKTINVNLSPGYNLYLMVYVSSNEQDIYIQQTSTVSVYSEIDVNNNPYLYPGSSIYYSESVSLSQTSGSRYVGFTIYNNQGSTASVQLSLVVTRWRSYSSLSTAISTGIIALIAILAAGFVIIASIIAICARRKRLQRLRQQQSARVFSSPVITPQPLQPIQNQTLEQQQMSYGISPQNPNDPYLQNTQYYVNPYPAAQPQYVQGYPQAYPQVYDPNQPIYYMAQPQMQGPATQFVVQGQPQRY